MAPSACFFWGFLFGIALHSLYAQTPFDAGLFSIGVCALTLLTYAYRNKRVRIPILLVLGLCVGVLRFELAQPTFPPTLRAFDPNAFAYQRDASSGFIADTRSVLSTRIQTIFPGDSGRLFAGILYGERKLSPKTKDEVRRAGLTHLVAVSGANVTIVFIALARLLKPLRWSKRRRFLALSIALVAFVVFVSPQAPVMRAAVMAWLIILAPLVGRIPDTKHLLLVAAVAFTAWRPESMFFDPSFILSFLAMLGLFTFGSRIASWIEERTRSAFFGELVGSTVGATLLVTPYSMWAFGQASAIGLIANLFAVPLVPWALAFGFIAIIIPLAPLAMFADLLLRAILGIATIAASIPFGADDKVIVSPWFMLISYVLMAIFWLWMNQKPFIHKKVSEANILSGKTNEMTSIFFT